MFKHVMLALDGTDQEETAMRTATELASESKGELTVVHVKELAAGRSVAPVHLDEPARLESVRREVAKLQQAGLPAKLEVYSSMENPARVIAGAARRAGADVIVTGAVERHGIGVVTSAAVPRKLLRLAPCPVLTVPAHRAAA